MILNKCDKEGTLQCAYMGLGDFECKCREGYKSRWCHISRDMDEVGACDYCNVNGGSCVRVNGSSNYTCHCYENWTGRHCQQRKIDDASQAICNLPQQDMRLLKESALQNDGNVSAFYEIARSVSPKGHIDACTTFNFQQEGCTLVGKISFVAMNKIRESRQGNQLESVLIDTCNGELKVKKQPFFVTPRDNLDGVKVSIYETQFNNNSVTVFHMCEVTPMFGKQEFVSLLSLYNNETVDKDTLENNSLNLSLSFEPTIQAHDFCS